MRYTLLATLLLVVLYHSADPSQAFAQPSGNQIRTWTDSTGQFQIQAELIRVTSADVDLKTSNGTVTVPFNKLSKPDQQHAMKGFLFSYESDGGYNSPEELASAYLAALKERSGQKIFNMYIPEEIYISGIKAISAAGGRPVTDEAVARVRERWRGEIYPEDEWDCQGQRTAHFTNGEFQSRLLQDGFDINTAQVSEVLARDYITTNPLKDSEHRGPVGIFDTSLRITFANRPGIYEIDVPTLGCFGGKWYFGRFGNINYFQVKRLPPNAGRSVADVISDLKRLKTMFNASISVETPNGHRETLGEFSDVELEKITFRTQTWDAVEKRYSKKDLPLTELPEGTQLAGITIRPKRGGPDVLSEAGAALVLQVIAVNPSLEFISIDDLEYSPHLVKIINALPDELQSITFSGKGQIPEQALNALPNKLQRLNIYDLILTDFSFLKRLSNLESLSLRGYYTENSTFSLKDDGAESLVNAIGQLKQLDSLTLRRIGGLSADNLSTISQAHPMGRRGIQLDHLGLGITDYAQILPKLKWKTIELTEDSFSLRDARSLQLAATTPWEFRILTFGSSAFKDLSDEEEEATGKAFHINNGPRVSIYLRGF